MFSVSLKYLALFTNIPLFPHRLMFTADTKTRRRGFRISYSFLFVGAGYTKQDKNAILPITMPNQNIETTMYTEPTTMDENRKLFRFCFRFLF